ncbi:Transmembrane_domain-containing protein [Hexamita inflata]|uniref:Transmembrane_domain-containing protein n=1 Tax=Hexamita inflata TaxID=28002 RepID=A0ABP1H480_9EUKA
MLALDKVRLQALITTGTDMEKRYVKKLQPLLEDRHLLIATILLGNALCTEILPEILTDMLGEVIAIILCVSVVVVGCEVIPQALMIKSGLKICASLSWFVWTLIYCSFIITWPLARLLDCILGKDHIDYYSRDELKELIQLHGSEDYKPNLHQPQLEQKENVDIFKQQATTYAGSVHSLQKIISKTQIHQKDANPMLTYDEVNIIEGIFAIHKMQVRQVHKPIDQVFMIEYNTILTPESYESIYQHGYSRIPIYFKDRQNIMGVLLTKQLIKQDPDEPIPVSKLEISPRIPLIPENSSLAQALKEFEKGTAHIAAVVGEKNFRIVGIVTLEDVLEQLLQEEIYDESDARRAYGKKK